MLITRLTKIVMCLVLAVFCLLIAYDNIADYNANYEFVQHVLSMDTTFPGNLAGVVQMTRALQASGAEFNRAKPS